MTVPGPPVGAPAPVGSPVGLGDSSPGTKTAAAPTTSTAARATAIHVQRGRPGAGSGWVRSGGVDAPDGPGWPDGPDGPGRWAGGGTARVVGAPPAPARGATTGNR